MCPWSMISARWILMNTRSLISASVARRFECPWGVVQGSIDTIEIYEPIRACESVPPATLCKPSQTTGSYTIVSWTHPGRSERPEPLSGKTKRLVLGHTTTMYGSFGPGPSVPFVCMTNVLSGCRQNCTGGRVVVVLWSKYRYPWSSLI